ncbi:RNA polymerase sigma-70 factor (ECF subfamily) [Novosphingobium sp. SG751A]|uniref:sigma-70 family RNA polymerase sigma factor n=1 Tax=Novosphingobium sp. SG751A TaxID=2587000 RepID=UPI00155666C2|nr:sigma-70 family RNA polymerase sigma factor [Novosphingobium sp. SG751A]NOW46367.1 RNA polymerase sigma-70 factor (ECF subfamily) [Novosphingobium sp. SG751A]
MTKQTQIDNSGEDRTALPDAQFRRELVAAMPSLRAFARSLCGNRDHVEDLTQETMMRAWAARHHYAAGTSFRAWTFTILRHHYFGQLRRQRLFGDYDEAKAEQILNREGDQESRLEAADVLRALETLPHAQREVLILMAVGSVSYEEIAQVCGITIGTVKSRISRARTALSAALEKGLLPGSRRNFAFDGEVVDAFFAKFKTIVRPNLARLSRNLGWAA